MSNIPEDIRAKAEALHRSLKTAMDGNHLTDLLAEALLTERRYTRLRGFHAIEKLIAIRDAVIGERHGSGVPVLVVIQHERQALLEAASAVFADADNPREQALQELSDIGQEMERK